MLYERWCRIAAEFWNEIALRDLAGGRQWTFAELQAAGENFGGGAGPVIYPEGNSPEFIIGVLAAWRTGCVCCPLERGQRVPAVAAPPANCSHLKTTSGTTGSARFVAFTGEQLAADAENIVATMGLRRDWPNVGVISLAHSYGFSNLVLPLLLHGIPLTLGASPLPESVRQAVGSHPNVTVPAVPAMWRAWHEAGVISRNIRLAISAGAPLPVALENEVFKATGVKIHNFYGSSECGGIAYDASEVPRSDDAFAGTAMRNVALAINVSGCLSVRSKAVAQTYWPEPNEALADGCFQTSDLAELNERGVFLRGRASDVINVAGRKVSPASIEREVLQHQAVGACLVFGVAECDTERGDSIVACVVKRSAVGGDELRRFLLERLPAWQVPRDWWFVESLQPNQVGKISRVEWRRRYLAR